MGVCARLLGVCARRSLTISRADATSGDLMKAFEDPDAPQAI
jgi:hypothetical protein